MKAKIENLLNQKKSFKLVQNSINLH